jgi:diacylglycerol O-acyltransferase / wax synthase
VAVVEPGTDRRPLTVEDLRSRVESRLAAVPRARQRLAPTPLGIASPVWVDDVDFELSNHVRPASDGVTDRAALLELAGRLMAERLDHARPLWCIDVVGPLEGGRVALVVRIHHCLADGVTALRLLSTLLWDSGEHGEAGSGAEWVPRPEPGALSLAASGATDRVLAAARGLARGARATVSRSRWRDGARGLRALPSALRRELWPLGARTCFDRGLSADRELAFTACELAELKRIETAAGPGVTVNDVVLALVAGAIRRWLEARHEHPQAMRVQIPVSMHHRDEDPNTLGNRDSFMFCDLPVAEPDPRKRLTAINAETRIRKERHDPDELYSFFHSLSHIRPLYRVASGLASGPREFALSVSNVPGPREDVHLLSGRVSELYSFAEPADRHALRASVISLGGRMGFGLCTDPGAVSGVDELAAGLDAALRELDELS